MAHSDPFPPTASQAVAAGIGQKLLTVASPSILAAPGAGAPAIGESFAIWMLGLDAVTRSGRPLEQLIIPTGRWHHQVRYGGKARAFARSTPTGPNPDSWAVNQLFESPIASKIDEAIDWIDKDVPGDPLVRLIIMPAFYLHAFWLSQNGSDQMLVIDMPSSMRELTYKTLYSPKEFLDRLAKEQHGRGVPQ